MFIDNTAKKVLLGSSFPLVGNLSLSLKKDCGQAAMTTTTIEFNL